MKQTHAGTASKTLWLEQHRNLKKVCRTKLFFDERVLKNVPTTVGRGVPFSVCRLVTIAIAAKRPSKLTTTGCRHAGGGRGCRRFNKIHRHPEHINDINASVRSPESFIPCVSSHL